WSGPVAYLSDSKYTLVLAQNILAGRGLELDRYFDATATPPPALSYQLRQHDGHVYLAYPNANAYLSLPFVALLNRCGLSPVDSRGAYDLVAETRMQRIVACGLAAALTALLYLGFRTFTSVLVSAAAALIASLGSVVLSNLTRALWTQTWAALLVGLLSWELLRDQRHRGGLRPAVVGSGLAWLALVRPPALLIVVGVLGYLLMQRRELLARTLLWMAPWCALVGAVNLSTFGTLRQPTTYEVATLFSLEGWWPRTGYVLASPSRGLLIFMPWVLLVLLALLCWRRLPARPVMAMALLATASYLAMLASYTQWIGGQSYGPRLWAEVVPLVALAATGGWVAARATLRGPARGFVLAFAILSSSWSLFVHARGAFAPETHRWNRYLSTRESRLKVIHDWSRAQFLEGLREPPPGPPQP
ncbi:MAG: hypothetical protein ABIV06_13830, partial [Thermoanaerobaculia bacterium]